MRRKILQPRLSWWLGIALAFMVLCALYGNLSGQVVDTAAAHGLWQAGEELKGEGEGERAAESFRQARAGYVAEKCWDRAGRMVHREGVAHWVAGDLAGADSLIEAIHKDSLLTRRCGPNVQWSWHMFQGKVRFALGLPDSAEAAFDRAGRMCFEFDFQEMSRKEAEAYYWKGKTRHFLKEDFFAAEEYYNKAILNWEHEQDTVGLTMGHLVLGDLYQETGDFQRAMQTLEWVLDTRKLYYGPNHGMVANVHVNLGNVHFEQRNFEKAKAHFETALEIRQGEDNRDAAAIALLHNNLGAIFDALSAPDTALFHYQKALSHYEGTLGRDHPEIAGILLSMGVAEKGRGDSAAARKLFEEALAISLRGAGGEAGEVYREMGRLCREGGDWEGALRELQAGMACLQGDLERGNVLLHPVAEPGPRGYLLIGLFEEKALALEGMARESGVEADRYWASCVLAYELADQLGDGMRRRFSGRASKGHVGMEMHGLYQQAVRVHLDLWRQGKGEAHLEKAFHFAEKSKSMVLWEALAERSVAKAAGLPRDLAEMEWTLRRDIATLDGRLAEAQEGYLQLSEAEALATRDSLKDLLARQDSLAKALRADFPAYTQLYHSGTTSSIPTLRSQVLDSETCLLHYFIGPHAIHLFLLTPTQFTCIDIPQPDSLLHAAATFTRLISSTRQFDPQVYAHGHALYQRLLAPALDHWHRPPGNSPGRLFLVTDGVLSAMPFEALATDPQGRFLIEDHRISYGHSATLQATLFNQKTETGNGSFLAFAWSKDYEKRSGVGELRSFSGRRYRSLPGSFREVQALGRHFEGDLYYGNAAKKERFLSRAAKYSALHFALHGEVSPSNPLLSHLVFPDLSDMLGGRLFAYELFDLPLVAELAVLSACETGIGEWMPGEGVHSLARAFAYSGVPAVTSTLWKVSDGASEGLVDRFYAGLAQGMDKDAALRAAKLELLEVGGRHGKMPFYWAPYVLTGDWRPLRQVEPRKDAFPYWWYILAGFLAVGLAVFIYRKKFSRR